MINKGDKVYMKVTKNSSDTKELKESVSKPNKTFKHHDTSIVRDFESIKESVGDAQKYFKLCKLDEDMAFTTHGYKCDGTPDINKLYEDNEPFTVKASKGQYVILNIDDEKVYLKEGNYWMKTDKDFIKDPAKKNALTESVAYPSRSGDFSLIDYDDEDDMVDADYGSEEYDQGAWIVERGQRFIEGGEEYTWFRAVSTEKEVDGESWQIWSAYPEGDHMNLMYFIVDPDDGFIDWGPVESIEEAEEFLDGKESEDDDDDYDEDDDLDEALDEDEDEDEPLLDLDLEDDDEDALSDFIEPGEEFIEGGEGYKWGKAVSKKVELTDSVWQVWSAVSDEGDNVFFVVDPEDGFIDWGPLDTRAEAIEFLEGKKLDADIEDDFMNDDDEYDDFNYDDDYDGDYEDESHLDESLNEDMKKFQIDYTVDGIKSSQTLSADSMAKAEELIKKQFEGNDLRITNKIEVNESLNEDMDDKVTESPETPLDTGLANALNALIVDEWEAIEGYNSALQTFRDHNVTKYDAVLQDIVAEENKHVGQLQEILKDISPNAENIEKGEEEGRQQIDGEASMEEIHNDIVNIAKEADAIINTNTVDLESTFDVDDDI